MAPNASDLVTFGIPGLALVVVTLVGFGVHRFAGTRPALSFALVASAWLLLSAILGLSGFLQDFTALPPRPLALMVPTLALPCWLAFSRAGARLASVTPLALLVGFQAFRLPLELVMHRAAVEGTMPPQMTYTGSNFDIVTGATALVIGVAALYRPLPRWLLLGWNTLGSGLLLAILVIAVASLPTFHAFGTEPQRLNTWVTYFPFVWLPAGLVSSALLGHLLLWRRLLSTTE